MCGLNLLGTKTSKLSDQESQKWVKKFHESLTGFNDEKNHPHFYIFDFLIHDCEKNSMVYTDHYVYTKGTFCILFPKHRALCITNIS